MMKSLCSSCLCQIQGPPEMETGPWLLGKTAHLLTLYPDTAFSWWLPANIGNTSVTPSFCSTANPCKPNTVLTLMLKLTPAKGLAVLKSKLMKLLLFHHGRQIFFCVVRIVMFGYARMPDLVQEHDAKKIYTKPTALVRHVWKSWNQPYSRMVDGSSWYDSFFYVFSCRNGRYTKCTTGFLVFNLL